MKPQFIVNGRLDMDKVLEKFVEYHGDIFAEKDEKYIESFGMERNITSAEKNSFMNI